MEEARFIKLRNEAELLYQKYGAVFCPYFSEKVQFNAKGIFHLKFKAERKARSQKDQEMRLKLLRHAPYIISKSHLLQGVWTNKIFEDCKVNSRIEKRLVIVSYYEFIAVIDNYRIKVIVKQIENKERFFLSVIPEWIRDSHGKRVLTKRTKNTA